MQRTGRKHDPVFRVIVAEHTTGPKSGKIVEKLGWYDAKQGKRELNSERIKYWMGQGAQVSGTLHNFLVDEKIVEGGKRNVLPKRKPKEESEEPATEQTPEAETAQEEVKTEGDAEAPTEENKEDAPAETEEKKEEPQEEEKPAEEEKPEEPKEEEKKEE